MSSKIAVIGLGLIGGSLGLALRRAAPKDTQVIGFDRDSQVASRAVKAGAVPAVAPTLDRAVADATMVIVATPIISIRKVFQGIAPLLRPNAIVTDTASTKQEVMRWAQEFLPREAHFIGGHPMAGKEQSGPQAAEAGLFDGRPYCLVPGREAGPGAVSSMVAFVQAIGATHFFLDAEEHDAYVAAISHVPLVASLALFGLARSSTAWPELANLAGPAFRDLTRLASGDPEMAYDIFRTNRGNLLHWIDRYVAELQRLAAYIEGDDADGLFRVLAEAQLERDNFLVSPPERDHDAAKVELPSPGQAFLSTMIGNWHERQRDLTDAFVERSRARQREERLRRREE